MLTSFNFMFMFHVYYFLTFVCKIYDAGCMLHVFFTHICIEHVKEFICRNSTLTYPMLKLRLCTVQRLVMAPSEGGWLVLIPSFLET